jgi:hypothetical protein
MRKPFDPVAKRGFWLNHWLQKTIDTDHAGLAPLSRYPHSEMQVATILEGYLVGLSNELKPSVEKLITWMESQPEPERVDYAKVRITEEGWRDEVYLWRQLLGLCKWLGRGDRAFDDLTAAIAADWQLMELASPEQVERARESRRAFMSPHLATAVAADAPLIGLKIYEAAGMKPPTGPATSPVCFGHWACRHLVDGGTRDETFVARGRDMLTANLLPKFYHSGGLIEPALWLKAIYFDSGVVQTPEQAIAKAYDSMPGVPRPDFIRA